jgi:hypothetical protein
MARLCPRRPVNRYSPGLVGCFQVVVDSLTGLIRQLELHWSPRLPLPHGCAIDCIAIRSNIIDLQGDDIATTELAVDGKIEQGEVAGSPFDQQPGPDRPNLVGRSGGLAPINLPLFQGVRRAEGKMKFSSDMVVLLSLFLRATSVRG